MSQLAKPTPRLLPAQDAAAYLNLSVAAFERLNLGRVSLGTKVLYDRIAIDRHLDVLAGLAAPSPPTPADNDAEAAFERSRPAIHHATRRT